MEITDETLKKCKDYLLKKFNTFNVDEPLFFENNIAFSQINGTPFVFVKTQYLQNEFFHSQKITAYAIENKKGINLIKTGEIVYRLTHFLRKENLFFKLAQYKYYAKLTNLNVEKEYQHKGIGSCLLKIFEHNALNLLASGKIRVLGQFMPDADKKKETTHFYEENGYKIKHFTSIPELSKVISLKDDIYWNQKDGVAWLDKTKNSKQNLDESM